MSEKELKKYLKIARQAALLSGRLLLKSDKNSRQVKRESIRDIKIKADLNSERIIIDYLRKKSGFSILSEEAGLTNRDKSGFTWIIDPLDGTLNYACRIPLSCVSIGLWRWQEPLLGVIYDFNRDELFMGIAGRGAWQGSRRIRVSAVAKKRRAILCTGFPANTDFTPEGIRKFIEDARSYKKIRMLGSAALSLAYVASGRADAYKENDIMLWDLGAGIPILLGAKGKFKLKQAKRPYSFHMFASNGCFF